MTCFPNVSISVSADASHVVLNVDSPHPRWPERHWSSVLSPQPAHASHAAVLAHHRHAERRRIASTISLCHSAMESHEHQRSLRRVAATHRGQRTAVGVRLASGPDLLRSRSTSGTPVLRSRRVTPLERTLMNDPSVLSGWPFGYRFRSSESVRSHPAERQRFDAGAELRVPQFLLTAAPRISSGILSNESHVSYSSSTTTVPAHPAAPIPK